MKKTVLFILGFLFLTSLVWGQNAYKLYINEIRANDAGTDNITFVELIGPAGTDITNFEILHYNQLTSIQWTRVISSFSIPDDGITDNDGNTIGFFILAHNSTVPNYDQVTTFDPQNGPGDFLVLKDDLENILDAVAWGSPTTGFTAIGLTQSGSTTANNYLHLTPNDSSTDTSLQAPDNVLGDNGSGWILDTSTPGAINSGQTNGGIILPVNLSSFYALYIGGTPTLYWTTQSEINNAYWNVFRGNSDNFEEAVHLNANDPVPGNGTTTSASDYVYVDTAPVIQNTTYWYWIEDVSTDGETEIHESITLSIPFEDTPITPDTYGLHQNYPNPFNPSTSISFTLEEESDVELIIYNMKGEKIKSIFYDHVYTDQITSAIWDGNDEMGKQVSSGVYFYKLITDTKEYQRKMLLVK